jgi:glutamyl-tRNA synthetase
LENKGIAINDTNYLASVITLIKDRCILMEDFYQQAAYFFQNPTQIDFAAIKPKWNAEKTHFFETLLTKIKGMHDFAPLEIETMFKALAEELAIKAGDLMLPLRIMLVGGKFGPHVFDIASMLGANATIGRIENTLKEL